MSQFHLLVSDQMTFPLSFAPVQGADGTEEGWCLTIDSTVAKIGGFALFGVAIACVAQWAPITFIAMTLVGCHFGSKLDWLSHEVARIWNAETHQHDGLPCQDRKVILGVGAAVFTYFAPTLGAVLAGQYVGRQLSKFL